MSSRILEGIIIGLCLGAVGASGKAILDVATLQERSKNQLDLIKEIKQDVKHIRNHLLGGKDV